MAIFYINFIRNLIGVIPLILLYYLCLTSIDTQTVFFKNFSLNLKYILIFYWTLRNPSTIGYGHMFFAGILNDVVIGLPMGTSSICFLILASIGAYIRQMTVRVSLLSDWIVFIPSVFTTNFIFFILLSYYSDIEIYYNELFYNSIVTIIFYPIFWIFFSFLFNYMRGKIA